MKQLISKILAVILCLNMLFGTNGFNIINIKAEAANDNPFNFMWDRKNVLIYDEDFKKLDIVGLDYINDSKLVDKHKIELRNMIKDFTDNDVLLNWKMSRNGHYILEYYVKDGQKIKYEFILKSPNELLVNYRLYKPAPADSKDEWENITENIDSYNKIDVSTSPIKFEWLNTPADIKQNPNPNPDKPDDKFIQFTIKKDEKNPGRVFKINDVITGFLWQYDGIYFTTDSVQDGCISPFSMSYKQNKDDDDPQSSKQLNILAKIKNFQSYATHYVKEDKNNENKKSFKWPLKDGIPGNKPGLDIVLDRPKVWSNESKSFSDKYNGLVATIKLTKFPDNDPKKSIKFSFNLNQNTNDNEISEIKAYNTDYENSVKYTYTHNDGIDKYKIKLVKDKSSLAKQDEFIEWDELDPSTFYLATCIISNEKDKTPEKYTEISTQNYDLQKEQCFTYLDYSIKRIRDESGKVKNYLEFKPYTGLQGKMQCNIYKADINPNNEDLNNNRAYQSIPFDTDQKVSIEIDLDRVGEFVQLEILFDRNQKIDNEVSKILSQIIDYEVPLDEMDPPFIPEILEITNKKLAYSKVDLQNPTDFTFDISFKAPDQEEFKELLDDNKRIYYELLLNNKPDDMTDEFGYKPIKIFEVSNDNGNIVIKEKKSDDDKSKEAECSYVPAENKFQINDLTLKIEDRNVKTFKLEEGRSYKIDDITKKYEDTTKELQDINFLRMRAAKVNEKEEAVYSLLSSPNNLTLDISKYEIPAVDSISLENIMESNEDGLKSFNILWDRVDLSNYVSYMLKPNGLSVDEVHYDIFLCQDKGKLENITLTELYKKNALNDKQDIYEFNQEQLNNLRQKEILYFQRICNYENESTLNNEKIKDKFQLSNLDNNQSYHVMIVTKLIYSNLECGNSKPSMVQSITTTVHDKDSIDKDKQPLVPDNFTIDKVDEDQNSITLKWDKGNVASENIDEHIGYELIRVNNKRLTNDKNYTLKSIEEIFKDELQDVEDKKSWLFDGEGKFIEAIQGETINNISLNPEVIKVTDKSLDVNTIYYYYLRAVKMEKDENDKYKIINSSYFTVLTHTSDLIKKPINVTVDYNNIDMYNPKTETIIYFDAPDNEYSEFIPEIYLFSQDDDTYKSNYKKGRYRSIEISNHENEKPIKPGYKRYYYKIYNLKPGMLYNIKVRLYVKNKRGSSPFSDRVTVRTEFDGDEYDKEIKIEKYLNYYDNKAAELYKTEYWVLNQDDDEFYIKFKNKDIVGLLQSEQQNYTIKLDDKSKAVFLIPQEMIDAINEEDIPFIINNKGIDVIINPESLSRYKNQEIRDFIKEVREKDKLRDYYIKFTINYYKYDKKINRSKAKSPIVDLNIEIIALNKKDDKEIEFSIEKDLEEEIANKRKALVRELKNKSYESMIDEEKLIEIVDQKIEAIKNKISGIVDGTIDYNTDSKFDTIYKVDKPITLSIKSKFDTGINLYIKDGMDWSIIDTLTSDYAVSADVNLLGQYIFAGNNYYDIIKDNIKGSTEVNNIISKYQLTDIYSDIDLLNLNSNDNKYSVINAIARIIGAPRDADAVLWLKNSGIKINSANLYKPIERQEAYYLLCKAYESANNTNLDSIFITNYFLISDYNNIDDDYKKIILQGATFNLFNLDTEGKFNPHKFVTRKEILDFLNKIENKAW